MILYEGLLPTGDVLPPVIFTNYNKIPKNLDEELDARVLYVPDLKGPSASLTLRWLGEIDKYLESGSLIVHDKGPEYVARAVQEELKENGYETQAIPGAGGAFANPCDNSFNSVLRQAFWKSPSQTFEEKLIAIIKAYYASSNAAIRHYFQHIGWIGEKPTRQHVRELLSEGYRPGNRHKPIYEEMNQKYRAWKRNLRDASRED